MEPIVLATGNPHKVRELRAIFEAAGVPVVGLHELGGGASAYDEPEEGGDTFEANARIKALAYASQTGRLCIADDSGLEVDALGAAPGVISSHYATDGRDTGLSREQRDEANNQRLLRELEDVPEPRRTARFVCIMCLVAPAGAQRSASHRDRRADLGGTVLAVTRGTFEGRIGLPPDVPRGEHGFGYDPIFLLPPPDTRTSADLPPPDKNRLSHRGAAARAMAAWIASHRREVWGM